MILSRGLLATGLFFSFATLGLGTAKSNVLNGKDEARALQILKEAEAIRSLDQAEVTVDLETEDNDKANSYDMKILRSTDRRAFIEFLGPKEEKGRRMLAKGRNYWSTFPDSKRVVAISRREMIGNSAFALADIFQIDTESDYKLVGFKEIERKDKPTIVAINLKSKSSEAPYDAITYYLEKDGSFPTKAKFYGASGKLLKTMTIVSRAKIAGRLRPSVTRMVDESVKGKKSFWKTKEMKEAEIPDSVFTKDYLRKP